MYNLLLFVHPECSCFRHLWKVNFFWLNDSDQLCNMKPYTPIYFNPYMYNLLSTRTSYKFFTTQSVTTNWDPSGPWLIYGLRFCYIKSRNIKCVKVNKKRHFLSCEKCECPKRNPYKALQNPIQTIN